MHNSARFSVKTLKTPRPADDIIFSSSKRLIPQGLCGFPQISNISSIFS
jgi:hypothetical protein